MNVFIKNMLLVGVMSKAIFGLSAQEVGVPEESSIVLTQVDLSVQVKKDGNGFVLPTGTVVCFFEDAVIDGGGAALVFAGGDAIQLVVMPGVSVTFKNITLYNFSLQTLFLFPGAQVSFAEGVCLYFSSADAGADVVTDVADDADSDTNSDDADDVDVDSGTDSDATDSFDGETLAATTLRHPSGMTTALHTSRQKIRELFEQVVVHEKATTVVLGPLPKAPARAPSRIAVRKRANNTVQAFLTEEQRQFLNEARLAKIHQKEQRQVEKDTNRPLLHNRVPKNSVPASDVLHSERIYSQIGENSVAGQAYEFVVEREEERVAPGFGSASPVVLVFPVIEDSSTEPQEEVQEEIALVGDEQGENPEQDTEK